MAWENNLDPNRKPEKQHASPIKRSVVKPHIGQARAGFKRKRPDPIKQLTHHQNCCRKFLKRPK